ncbi:MAG: hypothetical protein WBW48_17980 [Anaerolineae bacterium]
MQVERRPKIEDSGKGRLRLARVLILFLVGATILAGCGHIRVSIEIGSPDVRATEMAIAPSVVATLGTQAPSPTLTSVATITPVVTHTPTATPLLAATPTETPTTAPAVMPTATPMSNPPLTASQVSCRLSLLSPPDRASFGHETRVVTLQWQFDRALAPAEYFFVNVTYLHRGQIWYDGTWVDSVRQIPSGTRETRWQLHDYLCVDSLSDTDCFDWNVTLKQRGGNRADLEDEVECLSPTWSFCWSGCKRKPTSTPVEPTPALIPPTETPPPAPYPPPSTSTLPPYPP